MKRNNIHTMGIPEGEEKAKGADNIFKGIMAGNI